jgi:hypothetical protein
MFIFAVHKNKLNLKMNYKSFLTAILIAISTIAMAQKHAYIKFDTLFHDYGNVPEEKGKVVTKFNFTNTGNDTLRISSADPSCSCTTADWTRTPVPPGGSGYVVTDFDPHRRAGEIQKHVTVRSNATDSAVTLNFKVNVIAKTKTFNDSFPEKRGNLLFAGKQFNLRTINNEQTKSDTMEVYNVSTKPMKLSFNNLPAHITAKAEPETIAPSSRGKILISFNAAKRNDYGIISDTINLTTDDDLMPFKKVIISTTITDNFSKLTQEQKDNAPKIIFPNKETQEFGTVNEGEKVKVNFEFRNDGKAPLIIRKATPGKDDCKIIMPDKKSFAPGETGTIGIEFNTNSAKGVDIRRTILVTTNDPTKSFLILIIKGNITPKQ